MCNSLRNKTLAGNLLRTMARETISTPLTERLKHLRQISGLSGRELARLANLAASTCRLIESGYIHEPGLKQIQALAEVYGVSLDYIAHGVGPKPTANKVLSAVRAATTRAARQAA
jgi:transcriptional regulator with XRE-family HTH domain